MAGKKNERKERVKLNEFLFYCMQRIRAREAEFYELKCLYQEQKVQLAKMDERKQMMIETFFKMKEGYIDVLRDIKKEYERMHGNKLTSVLKHIDTLIRFIGTPDTKY